MEKQIPLKHLLQEKVAALQLIIDSNIPRDMAKEYVIHHRKTMGSKDLKSAWIDRDLIDYILKQAHPKQIDGLRIYMAKYTKDGTNPAGKPIKRDDPTFVVVPTIPGVDGHMDIEDAYFDYAAPCPPPSGCKDEPTDFEPPK